MLRRIEEVFPCLDSTKQASVFWALGKVNRPFLIVDCLLGLMQLHGESFNQEVSLQALFALLTYLPSYASPYATRRFYQVIEKQDITPFLNKVKQYHDAELVQLAKDALARMDRIKETGRTRLP
jgi:hypothetical protein